MIALPLTWLVIAYVGLSLGVIATLWLMTEWTRRRREVRARRHRVRCVFCTREFEDRTRDETPRCPGCGRLNDRISMSGV